MPTLPVIAVSTTDYERIERLLETPAARQEKALDGLRSELARARIVEAEDLPRDTVGMNSRVRLVDELSGDEHALELVYPHQADSDEGRISILAPMASALLGLSVGQSIDWQVPGGRKLRLKVLAVTPPARTH
jgi:regulator of nucleoside diphosphate kinase